MNWRNQFLNSRFEVGLFQFLKGGELWQAMRALADNRSIVIKKADKGSTVVVWERNDYILETEKQLSDANVYNDVSFN